MKKRVGVYNFALLFLLIASIVLLLVQVQQQQESRQRAQTANPTPSFFPLAPCPTCVSPSEAPEPSDTTSMPDSSISSAPLPDPCLTGDAALASSSKEKKSKHNKHHGAISGAVEALLKFFITLLELFLKLLGGGGFPVPKPETGELPENPQPEISQPETPETPETETPVSEIPSPVQQNPCPDPSASQPSSGPSQSQPSGTMPSQTASPAPSGVTTAVKRNIPIAPSGDLGNFNLSSKDYIMAFRFVLDKPTTIDRWYFAINAEGATCVGGRTGYGSGNGGTEFGRIVEVDQATGLPTAKVLAQESVNGCTAHQRTMTEFGEDKLHQMHFVQFTPINLEANKLYAFLLSNTDPTPGDGGGSGGNHTSPNLNFAKIADMGPNGKNTLDPNAPGALYGYDPRETTMWSKDGGKTWGFGEAVGWYDNNEGIGKMWVVGYRTGGKTVGHGYVYMNWPDESTGASVTFTNVPKAVTLTQAGGASSGTVGVVTVTNTSTGVSATTPSLGTGVPVGQLSKPVPVAAGQSYTIKASGSVETGSGEFSKIFGLGTNYKATCSACNENAMPAVFALPNSYN